MFDKVLNRGSLVWCIILAAFGVIHGKRIDIDPTVVLALFALSYIIGYYWVRISNENKGEK